jgi:hypothetical protein
MMSLLPPRDRALKEIVSLTSEDFVEKTLKSIEPWDILHYRQS